MLADHSASQNYDKVPGSWFLGFWISGFLVPGSWFLVSGSWFLGFWVSGFLGRKLEWFDVHFWL
jgi:hypothetical protein